MAVDTFVAYVGTYDNAAAADADYEAVKDLHAKAGVIDAYDAAVIERRAGGKGKVKSGPPIANSCVSCLPSRIMPASRNLIQLSASSSGT